MKSVCVKSRKAKHGFKFIKVRRPHAALRRVPRELATAREDKRRHEQQHASLAHFFIISGVFSGHWLWGVQGGFAVGARESLESGRPRTTLG